MLSADGLESFIFKKLTSKKFRKWAVDEGSENQIKKAINLAVLSKKPLQLRFPFGGYKLWRMPGSPEVDWAEFFSIAYYCRYLAPVLTAYAPGIEFLFTSDDVIIERMDNIPLADTDAYFTSFKELLKLFQVHFPSNFSMNIIRVGDMYEDKVAMEKELAENVTRFKLEFAKITDEEILQNKFIMSELNIKWEGAKNLANLSVEEKQKIIEMGPIYHDAYCALSKRRELNRGEDKILIFATIVPNAIAVGTTKSNVTKFWTGYGALAHKDGGFEPKIFSPRQLEGINFDQENIMIPGLSSKNFQQVPILK